MLFLIIRYNPFVLTLLVLIDNLRNYSVDGPGSCEAISLVRFVVTFINNVAPELVLLILLHGVLGTKRRYLALSTSLWMVLSLGVLIPQIMYFQKGTQADAVPRTSDGFNRFGRGYACSWYMFYPTLKGWESSLRIEAFVSLAKSLCTSALAITIFSLRYRSNRGPLVKVVRRDGGVCVLSLAAIRIGLAVATGMNLNLQPVSASTSIGLIVHHTFTQLQDIVVPMLACRLLLNMRETELDCGAHTITSIFFAPPRSNGEPENAAEDNLALPLLQVPSSLWTTRLSTLRLRALYIMFADMALRRTLCPCFGICSHYPRDRTRKVLWVPALRKEPRTRTPSS